MNKINIKDRLKNYGLWLSVAALIPMVLKGFNVNILPSNYEQIIMAILSILVMAGILNNPTTATKGFLDDPMEEAENEITDNNKK